LSTRDPNKSPIETLVAYLADKIVEQRFVDTPHYHEAWKAHHYDGIPVDPKIKKAIITFLKKPFGLPEDPNSIPVNHLEGYIGEMLWYFLSMEIGTDEIVYIDPPSFGVTEQGGDGFIIHRMESRYLMFRIWEVKKFAPSSENTSSHISGTIRTAFNQLDERTLEYLAKYTVIGQKFADEPEISKFCGEIVDHWIDASPQAAAGVSVATSTEHVPTSAFSNFGQRFPGFTEPVRMKGMITAIENFSDFAQKVREYVWKGL